MSKHDTPEQKAAAAEYMRQYRDPKGAVLKSWATNLERLSPEERLVLDQQAAKADEFEFYIHDIVTGGTLGRARESRADYTARVAWFTLTYAGSKFRSGFRPIRWLIA